ncbi:MAG TPA: hypothetical protein VFE51_03210 [Verrucomicrobiae bacterium]|nr:hypothetical protein [Verrucomicrobiae bacterium]
MKLPGTVWSVFVSLVLPIWSASAQGFVNLDFESATLVPVGAPSGYVQFNQAFPGWTATIVAPLNTNALYDNMNLDSAGISIIDAKAQLLGGAVIDGLHTALLQSGLGYTSNGAVVTDTTLSQTGLVPLDTQSLQFKAKTLFDSSGKFAVTLGGQTLSITTLGSGTNYTLYGANVSQWAGQTAQLSFTVFGEKPHVNDEGLFLDDIQFSSQSVSVAPPISLSTSLSGTHIEISWAPSGGTLESSPVVGPGATWSTVGTQNPTNIPVASGARFFRIGR